MRSFMVILVVALCSGCNVFKPYKVDFSGFDNSEVQIKETACYTDKKFYTQESKSLCISIQHVNQRKDELAKYMIKKNEVAFDYVNLGLGVLGVAALAADSHSSVLKGIGVASAGVYGLKTYNASSKRRDLYLVGFEKLTCVGGQLIPLSYGSKKYFKLLQKRHLLIYAKTYIDQNSFETVIDENIKIKIKKIKEEKLIENTIELIDKALLGYSDSSGVADKTLEKIISGLIKGEITARGDVKQIIEGVKLAATASQVGENLQKSAASIAGNPEDAKESEGVEVDSALSGTLKLNDIQLGDEKAIDVQLRNYIFSPDTKGKPTVNSKVSANRLLLKLAFAINESSSIATEFINAEKNIAACAL